jgi:hypothetical protein
MEELIEQLQLLNPMQKEESEVYMIWYNKILDFVLKKVITDIHLYTHIPNDEELPEVLEPTIVVMASNFITAYGLVDDETTRADVEIKKVTEGDTSVEYADRTARLQQAMAASPLTSDFARILNSVRRLP